MSVRLLLILFLFSFFFLQLNALLPFKQMTLFSDVQEIDRVGNLVCLGNVLVSIDEQWQVKAPQLDFDYRVKKGAFKATEKELVTGQIKNIAWTAQSALFDIDQKKVKIKKIDALQERVSFAAEEAAWEPEKAFAFKEVSCTTCKKKEPHWQLISHRLYVDSDKKIRSSGAYFKMGHLKIPLPLSFFSFSLKLESGFLIPRFYWDRIGGFGIKQKYYQGNAFADQIMGMHWLENKGMILSNQVVFNQALKHWWGEVYLGYGTLWQASSIQFPVDSSWVDFWQLLGRGGYQNSFADFDLQLWLSATDNQKGITKKTTQWIFEKNNLVDDFRAGKAELQLKKKNHSFSVFSDYTSFQSMKRNGGVDQEGFLERSRFDYKRLVHVEYRYEHAFLQSRLLFNHAAWADLVTSSLKTSVWKNQESYYQKQEKEVTVSYWNRRFFYQCQSWFRLCDGSQTPHCLITPSFFVGQKDDEGVQSARIIPSIAFKAEVPLPRFYFQGPFAIGQSKASLIWECSRTQKSREQFYGEDRYDQFFERDFFGISQQLILFYKEYSMTMRSFWGIDLTDEVQKNPLTRGINEGVTFPITVHVDLSGRSVGCSLKVEGAIEQGVMKGYQVVPFVWGKWKYINGEIGYLFQSTELARRRLLYEVGSAFFGKVKLLPIPGLELSYHVLRQLYAEEKGFINQVFQCLWKFDCWYCGIRFEQERSPFLGRMIDEWRIGFDFRLIFHD